MATFMSIVFVCKFVIFITSLKFSFTYSRSDHVVVDKVEVPTVILNATEFFVVSVTNEIFNNSNFIVVYILASSSSVKFRPSLKYMPDLPKWMRYTYSDFYEDGYLYGVPVAAGDFTIEVIATNKMYKTNRQLLHFSVKEKAEARYETEMKLSNYNLEDMFVDDRLERLRDIFVRRLWRDGQGVYLTLVESVVNMGGRRPTNQKEKQGVIVRIGSYSDFSSDLRLLQRQVTNIKNRNPCPKHYTLTKFENYFRKEFESDWCEFRLFDEETRRHNGQEPAFSPILLGSDDFHPPSPLLVTRDLLGDFLLCVLLPTITAFILAAALSFILFCHREGVDKRNRETPSIQMVQYASIQRASNNLRSLTSKRGGTATAATTPSSTVPHSYASSPNSTLPKGNNVKKSDGSKTISAAKQDDSIYGFPVQKCGVFL